MDFLRAASITVIVLGQWSIVAAFVADDDHLTEMIRIGSQAALMPAWFLAVYIMVAITVPATHWFFRRFGAASFGRLALDAL